FGLFSIAAAETDYRHSPSREGHPMRRLVIKTVSVICEISLVVVVIVAFLVGNKSSSETGVLYALVAFVVAAFATAIFFCLAETAENTQRIISLLEQTQRQPPEAPRSDLQRPPPPPPKTDTASPPPP